VCGSAFARRYAANDELVAKLRSVLIAALGVERAFAAGNSLNDKASVFPNEH
jgi:hypothetical protein